MIKRVSYIFILLQVLVSACSKIVDTPYDKPQEGPVPPARIVSLKAQLPGSKTALGPKDGDKYPNWWSEGDVVWVNGASSAPVAAQYAGTASAVLELAGVSAPYKAVYPASAARGEGKVVIPSKQSWYQGTYDPAAFLMVGASETESISFTPSVALFKLTPIAESGVKIRSVVLEALGSGISLSGEFSTDFATISPGQSASSSVTMTASGGAPAGEPFILAIAPSDMTADGFRIVITDTRGGTITRIGKPSKPYVAGKVFSAETDFVPVSASFGKATSCTLSFTWTEGASAADDFSKPWTIALYRDEACTDLVVSHSIPAGHTCWSDRQPRFVFGGLAAGTGYWFVATDTSSGGRKQSNVVKGTTLPFSRVDASKVSNAGVGDIILAEDFSEVHYGPDEFDGAAGFIPNSRTLEPITGVNPSGSYEQYNSTGTRLWGNKFTITEGTRLSHGWGFYGNSAVYSRAGYFRCSTTQNNSRTHIVTPKLAGIPEGLTATIEVTVTSRLYESNGDVGVFVSSDLTMNPTTDISSASFCKYTGGALTDGHALGIPGSGKWYTKSVVIGGVTSNDQLLIGSLNNVNVSEKSKNRHNFSDIVVKIVDISGPFSLTAATVNLLKPEGRRSEMSMDQQVVRQALARSIVNTGADIIGFNELDQTHINGGNYSLSSLCQLPNMNWSLEWPNDIHEYAPVSYSYANGFAYNNLRFRLEESGYVWLSKEEDIWYVNPYAAYKKVGSPDRTCIWARMTHLATGREFWLFVTHLPTNSQGGAPNMANVLNRFAASKAGSAPAILVGDMNSGSGSDAYNALTNYWQDGNSGSTWGTMSGSATSYYYSVSTFTKNHPERRYDHIMTRGCAASDYHTIVETYTVSGQQWCPSDHLPLVAKIVIE